MSIDLLTRIAPPPNTPRRGGYTLPELNPEPNPEVNEADEGEVNSDLVHEVLEFVRSGPLLTGNPSFSSTDVLVEQDFAAALDHPHVQFRWDQNDNPREDHHSWEDVRETELGNVNEVLAYPQRATVMARSGAAPG